jgi:hypothetical protein
VRGRGILGKVKTTRYFELSIRERPEIKREWCERVRRNPVEIQQQANGAFKMWGFILEVGKYLRVITLEDGETIDNAFFDRRYKVRR